MDAAAEVAGLYSAWFEAIVAHDRGFFERTLADEFIYTDIFGDVRSKDDYIGGLDLVPPDSRVELHEIRPVLYGDFALVTGHYEVSAVLANGKDVTSSTRFTSAWARRDGRWQALAHQATNANWKPATEGAG